MDMTTVAGPLAMLDCKWSRPGYRLARVEDRDQPEAPWVCVRTDARPGIADMECERCPNWEAEPRVP